jgi:hypothetical protein
MSTIDLPSGAAFKGAQFSLGLDVSESTYTGFLTGNRTRTSNLADRLRGTLTLPPTPDRATAAIREAILFQMRSSGDVLRMGIPHRLHPAGTLRGSPTVYSSVSAGARSVVLENGRAGDNMLRSADFLSFALGAGWSTNNATITQNNATDPDGGSTAWTLYRTASGNHFAYFPVTMAAPASRTVTFSIYIKAGTLIGDVVLRIRDGADVEYASLQITPTSTWALYRVSGTFGPSAAANMRFYVDPLNDAGSAGQTLLLWVSEVRRMTGYDTVCTATADKIAGPTGIDGAAEEVRLTGTGNAFTSWGYTTTAHANQTYTFSAYLKSGTFTGDVTLFLRDGAGNTIASQTVTPTSTWTRYSITGTFGASPAADIVVILDPGSGSTSQVYYRFGVKLQAGPSVSDFLFAPTISTGDFLSVGGNLLHVAYPGATGDTTGAITIPLTLPAPKAISAGAAVECTSPTGLWELDDEGLQLDYGVGNVQAGIAIPLRQVVL